MNLYLLFKSLHLIAAISWIAGLLYLPRIFVYHVENKEKKEATDIFEVMERRLFFYIMRPAMILTWVFGLTLIHINGIEIFAQLWMQIKIILVIILSSMLLLNISPIGKTYVIIKNKSNGATRRKALILFFFSAFFKLTSSGIPSVVNICFVSELIKK